MTADEIKNLIDTDIDRAFDILDNILKDNHSVYNDLVKEYISPSNNFNIATFRSKLKRLVATDKNINKDFLTNNSKPIKNNQNFHEADYQELCKLNFTHQINYFEKLVAVDKPLIQFVIRGEKNYGQRWLCNKLVYHYEKQNSVPNVHKLDFSSSNIATMQVFLDNLADNLKVEGYEKQKGIKRQKAKLRNHIIARVKTQSQIFVLENLYNFLQPHSNNYVEFYDFIEDLGTDIETDEEVIEHKCIFLFVENIADKYKENVKCMFTHECEIYEIEDILREEYLPKIIDLHTISPITKDCISRWFSDIEYNTRQKIRPFIPDIKIFINECDKGHPEKVIATICEKLGKTSDYPNKWLKY